MTDGASAGSLLCVAIVGFNLAVVRALCSIGRKSMLDRRVSSRTNSQLQPTSYRRIAATKSLASTPEELAFVRLMTALCVIFVICWMPQMVGNMIARIFKFTAKSFFSFIKIISYRKVCQRP
jgi:hypothetical protein